VLADGDDLHRRVSHQVSGGQGGPTQIGDAQLVTSKSGMEPSRGLEHRVTFGHEFIVGDPQQSSF